MPMTVKSRRIYRADDLQDHTLLTDEDRRRMLKTSLPAPNEPVSTGAARSPSQRRSLLGVRRFLKHQVHVFVFAILHGIFSLYIRIRQMWNIVGYQVSSVLYYHHGTPQYIQRDVMGLKKKPKHLSVMLKVEENHKAVTDLERLIDETAEVATWCACAEIPMLSVYEKTGILKKHMPRVYEATIQKFTFYFGGQHPDLSVTSPHKEELSLPDSEGRQGHLKLHLISSEDGRESLVDLTRTLAEMSQKGKLSPRDISMELIDAELSEGIMPEPELLILFGPHIELSGYPPWQIRLTEIFCLQDNEGFGYRVFLRALQNYSDAQFRRGR